MGCGRMVVCVFRAAGRVLRFYEETVTPREGGSGMRPCFKVTRLCGNHHLESLATSNLVMTN